MPADGPLVRRGSAFRSATWELGAQSAVLAFGLLAMAWLARLLGPAGYGQYAVLITVLCWVEYGLAGFYSRATIKAVAEADAWQAVARTILHSGLYVGGAFALGFALLAWPIASALGMPDLAWLVAVLALDVPVFLRSQIYLQVFAGQDSFGRRAVIIVARALTRVSLIGLVVWMGGGVPEAALTWLGASILELLVARSLRRFPLRGPRVSTRVLAISSLPLFVAAVCLKLADGLDIVIVKATVGGEVAGWYAGAANLALVPGFLGMALMPVILSTVSTQRKQRGVALAAQGASGWIRLGCLALPLVAIAALLSAGITEVVLGEAFGPAAAILPFLLAACAGRVWIALGTAFLAGLDMAVLAARFAVAYVVAAPIAVISGLWIYGPIGAAAGYAIVAWLGVACFMAVLMTIRTMSIPWLSATRSLVVIVAVTLAGSIMPGEGLVFLAGKALLLFVVAMLVFVMTGELAHADRRTIYRLLRGSTTPPALREAASPLTPAPQPEVAK